MVEPAVDSIEIREASPEDADALGRLIETVNTETEFLGQPGLVVPWVKNPEHRLRELRDKRAGVYLLAVHSDDLVGFLGAFDGVFSSTRGIIFIAHVGIRQAFRGRRVGTRLFERVESWARARGDRRLELRVSETNTRGQALYRKQGFVAEGRIVDAAFRDGEFQADCLMARIIGAEPQRRWDPTEFPSSPRGRKLIDFVVRAPTANDAAILQEFERALLTGSPVHLKLPSEMSELADIATFLSGIGGDANRFLRIALTGTGSEHRVVGTVDAWTIKGYRTEHDALFGLNVHPDFAGHGIGRRLAEALESWARERGLRRLTTWIRAHNARGARFAQRLGFRQEAISPNHAVIDGRVSAQVSLGKVLR
jgi:GNAT superfamily N-acetyltransferase